MTPRIVRKPRARQPVRYRARSPRPAHPRSGRSRSGAQSTADGQSLHRALVTAVVPLSCLLLAVALFLVRQHLRRPEPAPWEALVPQLVHHHQEFGTLVFEVEPSWEERPLAERWSHLVRVFQNRDSSVHTVILRDTEGVELVRFEAGPEAGPPSPALLAEVER